MTRGVEEGMITIPRGKILRIGASRWCGLSREFECYGGGEYVLVLCTPPNKTLSRDHSATDTVHIYSRTTVYSHESIDFRAHSYASDLFITNMDIASMDSMRSLRERRNIRGFNPAVHAIHIEIGSDYQFASMSTGSRRVVRLHLPCAYL